MRIWSKIASFEHPERRMLLGLDDRNKLASTAIGDAAQKAKAFAGSRRRKSNHLESTLFRLADRLESIYFAPQGRIRSSAIRRTGGSASYSGEGIEEIRLVMADFVRQAIADSELDCEHFTDAMKADGDTPETDIKAAAFATTVWRAGVAFVTVIQSGFRMTDPKTNSKALGHNLTGAYTISRSAVPPVLSSDAEAIRLGNLYLLSDRVLIHQSDMLYKLLSEMRAVGVTESKARVLLSGQHVPPWLIKEVIRPKRLPWVAPA